MCSVTETQIFVQFVNESSPLKNKGFFPSYDEMKYFLAASRFGTKMSSTLIRSITFGALFSVMNDRTHISSPLIASRLLVIKKLQLWFAFYSFHHELFLSALFPTVPRIGGSLWPFHKLLSFSFLLPRLCQNTSLTLNPNVFSRCTTPSSSWCHGDKRQGTVNTCSQEGKEAFPGTM